MTLPNQFLAIRDIGDDKWPYWSAASEDGIQLQLELHETLQWVGRCRVRTIRPNRWTLPDDTTLVVTDRRIAFLTTAYDKGGGWAGFGAGGLAVSTAANVISKRRAAKRSAGKVAIGQIRHEWIRSISLRTVKALIGGTDRYLDVESVGANGPTVIEMWGPAAIKPELASWLATLVAWQRLTLTTGLDESDRKTLQCMTDVGGKTDQTGNSAWRFPGDHERLVAAAALMGGSTE